MPRPARASVMPAAQRARLLPRSVLMTMTGSCGVNPYRRSCARCAGQTLARLAELLGTMQAKHRFLARSLGGGSRSVRGDALACQFARRLPEEFTEDGFRARVSRSIEREFGGAATHDAPSRERNAIRR